MEKRRRARINLREMNFVCLAASAEPTGIRARFLGTARVRDAALLSCQKRLLMEQMKVAIVNWRGNIRAAEFAKESSALSQRQAQGRAGSAHSHSPRHSL
jgi:hypothetical protein